MKKPEAEWSCKRSFGVAPVEEIRACGNACSVTLAKKKLHDEGGEFPKVTRGGLERFLRIYGYVFAAIYKWRKKEAPMSP